jgi:cellulose biosynthesis protein BcsS
VVALRSVIATVVAAAVVALWVGSGRAVAGGLDDRSFLLFTGTDIWRYGGFLYGGFLWSPKGLDSDGFTFKMLLDGGAYSYVSGALQQNIDGTKLSAAALPGWRFTRGGLNVTVFAGPVVQDYRLTPADPGSHLHGLYIGGETAVDIWYQPNAMTMAAVNGAIASIGPTGYVRGAIGVRLFDRAFVGPEIEEIWCGDFEELEFGAHITGLRFNSVEWSMASGLALTSDQRSGPYLRLGVNAHY